MIRLPADDGTLIPPLVFIPVAEDLGLREFANPKHYFASGPKLLDASRHFASRHFNVMPMPPRQVFGSSGSGVAV
jgi:hypothetical protein